MKVTKFFKQLGRCIRIGYIHHKCQEIDSFIISNIQKAIIVAPHPDDETLGCSGLIQHLLESGKKVYVIILSGGGKSHFECCHIEESKLINNRRKLSIKSAEILGLTLNQLFFLDYPDGNVSYNNSETLRLHTLIKELVPDAIFIPHNGEGWNDHIEAGRIVREIIRKETNTIQLYEYCVWFWYYNSWNIDWKNAYLLKMNKKEHKLKLKAIDAYVKPLAPCGKPWSGVLPNIFVKANQWNCELYFKAK